MIFELLLSLSALQTAVDTGPNVGVQVTTPVKTANYLLDLLLKTTSPNQLKKKLRAKRVVPEPAGEFDA